MLKALVMVTRTNGTIWRTPTIVWCGTHPATGTALFALVLIAWMLCGVQLGKAEYDRTLQPVARQILALYDSSLEATPAETRIHRWAEMPLNHLGYVLTYRDIREPLPTIEHARQFAGVLTWFPRIPLSRHDYLDWATKAAQAGAKFVILGEIGGRFWSSDLAKLNALLAVIGLQHTGRFVDITFDTVVLRKPDVFEAGFDPLIPPYPVLTATRSDVDAIVELAAPAREGGGKSLLVATSPRGGYAASGFEMMQEPRLNRVRWLIDPFAFFTRALQAEDWPKPDITTRSGRRVFFSHIDASDAGAMGDEADNGTPLPHVLLQDIIRAYPDIPTSVALRPSRLDSSTRSRPLRELLQNIWSSANVDPVVLSETCRHGQIGFFQDPVRTRCGIDAFSASEVMTPIKAARELAADTSPIHLFQWAKNVQPADQAIAALRTVGLSSIAEREGRFDADFPSIAYVSPISRPADTVREPYVQGDASRDERETTVSVLRNMQTRLARTETPRRLTAFNLHYRLKWLHEPAALKRIESWLDNVRSAKLAPIRTTEYATMAADFDNVQVSRIGERMWKVEALGSIRTFRFDRADGLQVDLARSQGVLGQNRHGTSLYITLDAAQPKAIIALTPSPADGAPLAGLRESRWTVSTLVRKPCGWAFIASGFGPGEFSWYGVGAREFDVVATRDDVEIWRTAARAGGNGNLSFVAPILGVEPIAFEVRCRPAAGGAP